MNYSFLGVTEELASSVLVCGGDSSSLQSDRGISQQVSSAELHRRSQRDVFVWEPVV